MTHGNWTQHEAVQIVAVLDGLNVYVEQPCATMEEGARVKASSRHPFILDESLLTSADVLRAHELNAMDEVMLNISRFSGITPVKKARDISIELGLAVTVEDSGGGDIITAAMAHLSASTPERFFMNGFFTGSMVKERITEWGCKNSGGFGELPAGSSLGISVDEEILGKAIAT